jgi:hypothetical protein
MFGAEGTVDVVGMCAPLPLQLQPTERASCKVFLFVSRCAVGPAIGVAHQLYTACLVYSACAPIAPATGEACTVLSRVVHVPCCLCSEPLQSGMYWALYTQLQLQYLAQQSRATHKGARGSWGTRNKTTFCCVRVVAQLVRANGAVRLGVLSSYFCVWVVVQLAPATGAAPVFLQRVCIQGLDRYADRGTICWYLSPANHIGGHVCISWVGPFPCISFRQFSRLNAVFLVPCQSFCMCRLHCFPRAVAPGTILVLLLQIPLICVMTRLVLWSEFS